jgi:hypothetical protein
MTTSHEIDQRLASMSDELEAFCKQHRLPFESADELILRSRLTKATRQWLAHFIERWEATTDQYPLLAGPGLPSVEPAAPATPRLDGPPMASGHDGAHD